MSGPNEIVNPSHNKKNLLNEKTSPLPKPDFTSIEKKESSFKYKEKGSYKKPKSNVPESPMKSPNQKFFTPVKLQSNLFGNASTCRKLVFSQDQTEVNTQEIINTKKSLLDRLEDENQKFDFQIERKRGLSLFEKLDLISDKMEIDEGLECQENTQGNSKFEEEFITERTIDNSIFSIVYQCLSKSDGIRYAVKKSKKSVSNRSFNKMIKLIDDFNLLRKFNIFSNFCINYREAWLEDNSLFIKQDYCEFGDLLNYLENLYNNKYTFTPDFYWDLIFEMLNGAKYVHDCGYIHLDIKPSNFLVTEEGCIKLADFGLSKKINNDEDEFEGDSIYLAPEILKTNKIKELNYKCDIFSLGLSILEILFNVELPQSGKLWNEIRSKNFQIPNDFYERCNLKVLPIEMIKIIKEMININPLERPDIEYFYENYIELKVRLNKLIINKDYQRVLNPRMIILHSSYTKLRKNNSFDNYNI